jgi:hypothetical protein
MRHIAGLLKRVVYTKYLKPGSSVLDLACGPGTDLHKFAHARIGELIAVDFVEEALEEAAFLARNNTRFRRHVKALRFLNQDLSRVVCRINPPVDTVLCQNAMHYFWGHPDHIETILTSVRDSLRAGGHFIATVVDSCQIPPNGIVDHPFLSISPPCPVTTIAPESSHAQQPSIARTEPVPVTFPPVPLTFPLPPAAKLTLPPQAARIATETGNPVGNPITNPIGNPINNPAGNPVGNPVPILAAPTAATAAAAAARADASIGHIGPESVVGSTSASSGASAAGVDGAAGLTWNSEFANTTGVKLANTDGKVEVCATVAARVKVAGAKWETGTWSYRFRMAGLVEDVPEHIVPVGQFVSKCREFGLDLVADFGAGERYAEIMEIDGGRTELTKDHWRAINLYRTFVFCKRT